MSTPERELPPLRVKILGDNSGFKKAHDEAVAMAKGMEEHIKKATRGPGGVGADKETIRRIKGMNKAYANQVRQDDAALKADARESKRHRTETLRRMKTQDAAARKDRENIDRANAARQKAHDKEMARMAKEHSARRKAAVEALTSRFRAPGTSSRPGGSGRSNFGGLTNRADIYMHMAAIKQIASAWREPLQKLVDYQRQIATLTPVMGGKAAARGFVDKTQKSPLGMVYGDSVTQAAARFQPITKDAKKTDELLTVVGDLARGDAQKYQGISRVLSQVMAQGYLQGDELEQFAENEIPLTEILSRKLKVSTAEVRKYGEQRRLSAALITAALKEETAAGGTYAGALNEIAKTLGVAAQRATNLFGILQRSVMETVEKEFASAVNVLSAYIQKAIDWVEANKEATKEMVMVAMKVSAAAAAFHIVAGTVAVLAWNLSQVGRIVGALRGALIIFTPLMWVWQGAIWACNAAWSAMEIILVAIKASLAVLGGPITAIVALVAAFALEIAAIAFFPLVLGAIALAAWDVGKAIWWMGDNFDTTWAAMERFATDAQGFMWNFGHNIRLVAKYVVDNWKAMANDMAAIMIGVLSAIPHNMAVMWNTGVRLTFQFINWLVINLPRGVKNAFDAVQGVLYQFITNAMTALMDLGLAMMNPMSLVAGGAAGIAAIVGPLMGDTAVQLDKGLWESMKHILEDSNSQLRSGLEGFKSTLPELTDLKLDMPKMPKALPEPNTPTLPADGADFNSLLGEGKQGIKGKAGNKGGISTAPLYRSSDHAKQLYANTERMNARKAGTPGKGDPQQEANKLLKSIERNTRAPQDGMHFITETAMQGVN